MSKVIRAEITPETISWARKFANIDIDLLAWKVQVKAEQILEWETGEKQPTINQLFRLAKACDVPFSLFFFEDPPEDIPLPVKDFRKVHLEDSEEKISYELTLEIRNAIRIRKLALEVFQELEINPPNFTFFIDSFQKISYASRKIREFLEISFSEQKSWRKKREAFNQWRRALEKKEIIVLQSASVDVKTMRGFSISTSTLPVIVVNRKDAYSGRIFSLIHEFVHIATRTSGLCDFSDEYEESSDE